MNIDAVQDRAGTALPQSAVQAGTLGLLLHRFFPGSCEPAAARRPHPGSSASAVSIAGASVCLATRIFGRIAEQNVLFIGAGRMIELLATHFGAERPQRVTVANRTVERARRLARRINGEAITLAELPGQLALYDIVITCTVSPLPIVGKGMVERAIRTRKHRPILMVDLAQTPDVEPEVAELDDVFLFTAADLAAMVGDVAARRAAHPQRQGHCGEAFGSAGGGRRPAHPGATGTVNQRGERS